MASTAPWTDDDLAVLDSHVDQPDWLRRVCALIHGRTVNAIKVRMAKRRAELGLSDGRRVDGSCTDDDWMPNAAAASQALLAAIQRAGVHP